MTLATLTDARPDGLISIAPGTLWLPETQVQTLTGAAPDTVTAGQVVTGERRENTLGIVGPDLIVPWARPACSVGTVGR